MLLILQIVSFVGLPTWPSEDTFALHSIFHVLPLVLPAICKSHQPFPMLLALPEVPCIGISVGIEELSNPIFFIILKHSYKLSPIWPTLFSPSMPFICNPLARVFCPRHGNVFSKSMSLISHPFPDVIVPINMLQHPLPIRLIRLELPTVVCFVFEVQLPVALFFLVQPLPKIIAPTLQSVWSQVPFYVPSTCAFASQLVSCCFTRKCFSVSNFTISIGSLSSRVPFSGPCIPIIAAAFSRREYKGANGSQNQSICEPGNSLRWSFEQHSTPINKLDIYSNIDVGHRQCNLHYFQIPDQLLPSCTIRCLPRLLKFKSNPYLNSIQYLSEKMEIISNASTKEGQKAKDPDDIYNPTYLQQLLPAFRFMMVILESRHSLLWLAKSIKSDETQLAVKITKKASKGSRYQHQQQELEFIRSGNSQLQIYQVVELQKYVVLVMKYYPMGDMNQLIKRSKYHRFSAPTYLLKIIDAVEDFHSHGYVHRDIKPNNILLTQQKVVLCDFGFVTKENSFDSSLCGTLPYIAPERLLQSRSNRSIQRSIDIWAIGIIAYELLTGSIPFDGKDENQIWEGICLGPDYNGISLKAVDFIKRILEISPEKRPTLQQIKAHPYLREPY